MRTKKDKLIMDPNTKYNMNQFHLAMDIVFQTPILVQKIMFFLPFLDMLVFPES